MRFRFLLNASLPALLFTLAPAAQADGVLPPAATPVQREQAQARFLRGKDLLTKKQYEDALGELRASHEIVASPNTRLQIARCLLAMEKTIEAYAEFGRAAIEAKELAGQDKRYERAYDAALAERAELEPRLGFVSLTIANATDETTVNVAGEEIRPAAWNEPVPVQPGAAEISVLTPGHEPIKRAVTLAAGERLSLALDALSGDRTVAEPPAPPPPPPPRPPEVQGSSWMRTGSYVAGGVGVAGLATFAVFGLLAKSTYDDLNASCMGGPCAANKVSEISSGKTDQTVANVGLVLGLVGAGTGAALFVLSMPKASRLPNVAIAASPGWIGIRGSL
jgi:hypothetical protein